MLPVLKCLIPEATTLHSSPSTVQQLGPEAQQHRFQALGSPSNYRVRPPGGPPLSPKPFPKPLDFSQSCYSLRNQWLWHSSLSIFFMFPVSLASVAMNFPGFPLTSLDLIQNSSMNHFSPLIIQLKPSPKVSPWPFDLLLPHSFSQQSELSSWFQLLPQNKYI